LGEVSDGFLVQDPPEVWLLSKVSEEVLLLQPLNQVFVELVVTLLVPPDARKAIWVVDLLNISSEQLQPASDGVT